jgi:hypothetical protein
MPHPSTAFSWIRHERPICVIKASPKRVMPKTHSATSRCITLVALAECTTTSPSGLPDPNAAAHSGDYVSPRYPDAFVRR